MIMSNFYVKSKFKANVAGYSNRYLYLSAQFWLLKFKRRLTGIVHLNGAGATRFLLMEDYLRI